MDPIKWQTHPANPNSPLWTLIESDGGPKGARLSPEHEVIISISMVGFFVLVIVLLALSDSVIYRKRRRRTNKKHYSDPYA